MLRRRCRSVKSLCEAPRIDVSSPQRHLGLVSVRRDDSDTRGFLEELGARIREARESVGIDTIAEFSRRIDADRSTVTRWEAGKGAPDAVNLRAIAAVTKTSADWLLRGFAAPSWRHTYEEWAKTARADSRARIWLESLPLEGYEPSAAFYDLALVAFRHGLSVAQAIQMATETMDADRELENGR